MEKEESQLEMQTVETPKTASQRIIDLSTDIDFGLPPEQDIDYVMKDYTMNLSPERARDMVRNSGIQSSFGEQVATGVEGVVASLSMLPDQASIAYGNLTNYFSDGKIGEELQNAAFDNLQKRMADIGYNEEAIGGVNDWLAQLVTGGASFMELALVSMATGGVGGLAQIVTQEMGEGFYNDMQAYLDVHGSLDGYKPKGSDVALNIANTILQAGIESYLGVGSPRFLTGWSRGLWKEGLSGFGQEFAQGALSDFNEFLKGNIEAQDLMEQADQWVRDGIVGGVLQGTLGAATYGTARRKHDMLVARAHAMYKGRKEPNKEDMDIAKKLGDLKEQGYGSAFTEEFKKRFDATSPVGQLQQKIATAINDAYKAGKIDFGGASETQIAQKIESFAAQETLNAMEDSAERKQSIGEHELNSIVFKGAEGAKEGELWLAGLEPEVGERSVDLAKVLEYRQSGLAEINAKLDELNSEVKQTQAELKEATAQKKAERVELLQARIENTNAQIEKQRLQKERVEASTARLQSQIAKMSAPKAEKASEQKSLKAEREQEKAVKEQRKQAREKKPQDEFLHQDVTEQPIGETIVVDGVERPTKNSNGDLIGNTVESLTNFWKWFGDSKVVDEDGRPLVVYHGALGHTNLEEISPDYGFNVKASYFSDNKNVSSHYAESGTPKRNISGIDKKIQETNTTEGLLNILNESLNAGVSLVMSYSDKDGDYYRLEEFGGNVSTAIGYKISDMIYKMSNGKETNIVEELKRVANSVLERIKNSDLYPVYLSLKNPLIVDAKKSVFYKIPFNGKEVNTETIVGFAQDNNYDGVIVKDVYETDYANLLGNDYITFNSKQVKHIDNIGTWSADEKNMLKQSRPDQSRLDKGDTYRGAYDEKLKRIILNEKSDLTTIQHEFAHYWIQNNFRWYRSGLASDDWKRNWERVEQALGIEPTDKYLSKVASERFARAYERYIMEGKVAPEYQWAFAEFQEFYNEVYDDLKAEYFDLNEELSPELIDWFNRQRPVAPEQVAEMRQNQVRSAIAQAPDNTIIESVGDGYAVVEENEQGEIESTIVVPKESISEEQFGVPAKKTKSGLQESLRKRFGDDVNVDELVALDSVETLAQAESIIASNPQLAWEQMLSDSTNDVKRAYLYKAFAKMAENDPQIAVDLSNTNMAQWAREKGQAIQALNINDELGLSPHTILAYMQNAKGKMSQEQLAQALNEIDLYAELSAEDTTLLENETECLL